MSELESITLETQDNPDATVIWLHGLGADGNDFLPIVEQLQLPSHFAIRFIFPHAPVMPVTINQGYPMPAWYDIRDISIIADEDEAGITRSSIILKQLCEQQEAAGIKAERIVLAGFSQGGAIALHCGTRYPKALAGIMALSTYLPLPDSLQLEMSEDAVETPVFMAHGRQDDVLAYNYGRKSMEKLTASGFTVNWHEYDMTHAVCQQEIHHIRQWLTDVL